MHTCLNTQEKVSIASQPTYTKTPTSLWWHKDTGPFLSTHKSTVCHFQQHTHSKMRFSPSNHECELNSLSCQLYFFLFLYPLCSCPSSHQHFNIISSVTNFICSPPVSMPTHPPAPQTPGGGYNWLKPDTPTVASNQIKGLILHIIQSNWYEEDQGEGGIGGAMKRSNGSLDTHTHTHTNRHTDTLNAKDPKGYVFLLCENSQKL